MYIYIYIYIYIYYIYIYIYIGLHTGELMMGLGLRVLGFRVYGLGENFLDS